MDFSFFIQFQCISSVDKAALQNSFKDLAYHRTETRTHPCLTFKTLSSFPWVIL